MNRRKALRNIMLHAGELRRKGIDSSTALKFAWAYSKADKSQPVGDVYQVTFAKATGEVTTRIGLDFRGGKAGTIMFVSSSDDFQLRSFRPERLMKIEPKAASEPERQYFEIQTRSAA